MQSSSSAGAVDATFHTQELLEMILLHLSARDILAAQQVNKSFNAAVTSSPRVQQHLGLKAISQDINSVIPFTLGCEFPDFACTLTTIADHLCVNAKFDDLRPLPTTGERCRSMLVCNPPVKKMVILIPGHCCYSPAFIHRVFSPSYSHYLHKEIHNENGITVGDILSATKVQRWYDLKTSPKRKYRWAAQVRMIGSP